MQYGRDNVSDSYTSTQSEAMGRGLAEEETQTRLPERVSRRAQHLSPGVNLTFFVLVNRTKRLLSV